MAEIKNLERLVANLRVRAAKAVREDKVSVIVGYTASYALYVHENREPKHSGEPRQSGIGVYWGPSLYGPGFLLGPARGSARDLADIVMKALSRRATMANSLLLAGLRLQRESQLRVPVEYGNLKASAFTRVEKGA